MSIIHIVYKEKSSETKLWKSLNAANARKKLIRQTFLLYDNYVYAMILLFCNLSIIVI